MKNSIIVIAVLLLVSLQTINAQDILELSDGARIEIKIVKEMPEGIKYLRLDVENSDTFTIKLADISYRRTLNNHKEIVLNGFKSTNSYDDINIINVNTDQPDTVNSFWLNIEGGSNTQFKFVYDFSLNLLHDVYLFSFEYLTFNMPGHTNFDSTISSTGTPLFAGKTTDVNSTTTPSFSTYRFLFGKTYYLDSQHNFSFDISAGLSLDNLTNTTVVTYTTTTWVLFFPDWSSSSSSSSTNRTTIGLPINLKLHIPTNSAFGLDFGFKADINTINSFMAGTIGLRIGRIVTRNYIVKN